MGNPPSKIRAIPRRWRWPPDIPAPCPPTSVSRPAGSCWTQSCSRARCSVRCSSGSLGVVVGQEEVRPQGGAKM